MKSLKTVMIVVGYTKERLNIFKGKLGDHSYSPEDMLEY